MQGCQIARIGNAGVPGTLNLFSSAPSENGKKEKK
jgi:hypothetical protein